MKELGQTNKKQKVLLKQIRSLLVWANEFNKGLIFCDQIGS